MRFISITGKTFIKIIAGDHMPVKHGDTVVIEYTGKFTDGTVFIDSKKRNKPLIIEIGSDKVMEGMEELIEVFEEAIMGLEIDQETDLTVDFNDYSGPYDDQLVRKIPLKSFPDDEKLEAGKVVTFGYDLGLVNEASWSMQGVIAAIDDNYAMVNLNPPFAGKKAIYHLKVKDIRN